MKIFRKLDFSFDGKTIQNAQLNFAPQIGELLTAKLPSTDEAITNYNINKQFKQYASKTEDNFPAIIALKQKIQRGCT